MRCANCPRPIYEKGSTWCHVATFEFSESLYCDSSERTTATPMLALGSSDDDFDFVPEPVLVPTPRPSDLDPDAPPLRLGDLESIVEADAGRYLLTTKSGARHLLDLDQRYVVRHGAPGKEWAPKVDERSGTVVEGDGEPFFFSTFEGGELGDGMVFYRSDGRWRQTSRIKRIERIA